MASQTALLLGAAVVGALLLASGKSKAAGTGEFNRCLRVIGKATHDALRSAPRHTVMHFADICERIGQPATAACLRRMADDRSVDCSEEVIAAITKDVNMIFEAAGGPQGAVIVRGWAAAARANGMNELADCYDVLADTMGG